MKNLKIQDSVEKSFRFSFQLKKFLPYFVFQLVVFAFMAIPIWNMIKAATMGNLNALSVAAAFASNFGTMMLGVLVAIVLGVLVQGTYIHNYRFKKSLKKSFNFAKKKFWSLLGVMLAIAVLTTIASLIPVLGWLLSLIVTLALIFGFQAVVLNNMGFSKAIKKSWNIFRKNWLGVLVAVIVMSVISIVIAFLFAIPMLFVLFSAIASFSSGTATAFSEYAVLLLLTGLVFLLGSAISKVFQIAFLTEMYMKLKGR